MGMEMCRPVGNGILQSHMTLKPLMQIPSLSDVDGSPTAVLVLPGININTGQRSKGRAEGIDLVLILRAGLPGPIA